MAVARLDGAFEPKDVTAAILVGGQGTRLRSLVDDRPKPIAKVSGRPFLYYLLEQLHQQGVRRAVLCTGYRANQIENELGTNYKDLLLEYSVEREPLGTGGALRQALCKCDSDPLLVLNGDSYCDFQLRPFLAWHQARRAAGSLWLTQVDDGSRFGKVQTDSVGEVTQFVEKQVTSDRDVDPHWINAGVYLLSSRILESIEPERKISLERTTFPGWVDRGLCGYRGGGRFLDIGTPETYEKAAEFFRECEASMDAVRLPVGKQSGRCRAVLLDRDGVINQERHYLSDADDVELIPGAAEGLSQLQELGFCLVVVTNQSAIGRGYLDEKGLAAIHSRLAELLAAEGVVLDGVYHCPHTPDENCGCRKPAPGLVLQASREHDFDPSEAFLVGDKKCDVDLGKKVGATTFLVMTGHGREELRDRSVEADYVAPSLKSVAEIVEGLVGGSCQLKSEGMVSSAETPLR